MPGKTGTGPALKGGIPAKARSAFSAATASHRRLPKLVHEISQSLLSVVLPTECFLCRHEVTELAGLGVCRECWSSLELWDGTVCSHCGLPLVAEHLSDSGTAMCSDCRLDRMAFDTARVYGLYRGPLRQIILKMKFARRERLGERLGALLAEVWTANPTFTLLEDLVLVPVPLFPSRERERGFNQSLAIARGLRRRLRRTHAGKIALEGSDLLKRVRPTVPQTGLSLKGRKENVKGAFSVADAAKVRDRAVVLIDDVMTTGATLSACASALKSAGARTVLALAVARATPQFPDLDSGASAANVDDKPQEWT